MTPSGATSDAISSGVIEDNFTPEFKRLKARQPPPNFDKVIDLHCLLESNESSSLLKQYDKISYRYLKDIEDFSPIVGIKSPREWKVLEFQNNPGFLIVLNPFLDGYQRYWVSRCLHDFPMDKANVTNMTENTDFDYADVWQKFIQKSTFQKKDPLKKLRWTTLGYHHDWNTKEYSESKKGDFPHDVHLLSQYISQALGFGQYNAEAAIVNYYHMDSTLAGHTDHSEKDLEAPLLSISFGQTAIFLLGGQTKTVEPTAVYLRSGDICVMSGQSRLAYHAVPRVLPPWTAQEMQRLKDTFNFPVKLSSLTESETVDTGKNSVKGCELTGRKLTRTEQPHSIVETNNSTFESKPSDQFECMQDKCTDSPGFDELGTKRLNSSKDERTNEESQNKCIKLSIENQLNNRYSVEKLNSQILKTVECTDFQPFHRYLSSSRINLNIRQVNSLLTTDLI